MARASFTAAALEHIAFEETRAWPGLRTALTPRQASDLGDALTKAKESGPTRPHPNTPASPGALKAAGPAVGLADKARDKITGRGNTITKTGGNIPRTGPGSTPATTRKTAPSGPGRLCRCKGNPAEQAAVKQAVSGDRAQVLQRLGVDPVGDQHPDLTAGEGARPVAEDAERRGGGQVSDRFPGRGQAFGEAVQADTGGDRSRQFFMNVAQSRDHALADLGPLALAELEGECLGDVLPLDLGLADIELPSLAVVVGEAFRACPAFGPGRLPVRIGGEAGRRVLARAAVGSPGVSARSWLASMG
jgi:hypothetical protein